MAYFLKKSNIKKGIYLQIYESYYDPNKKQTAHRSYQALGYVHELEAKGIQDPVTYYKNEVVKLNQKQKAKQLEEKANKNQKRIGANNPIKSIGYFPLAAINRGLNVKPILAPLNLFHDHKFDLVEILEHYTYARALNPKSKAATYTDILPEMGLKVTYSQKAVYQAMELLGKLIPQITETYTKSLQRAKLVDLSKTYFDCTNFYFEIDRPDELRKKGPSKENRSEPIVSLALILDNNQLPLAMEVFAGNESEKPHLRNMMEKQKKRLGITHRMIQVADKGLVCGENIQSAKTIGDGYIFGQSLKKLPKKELHWATDLNKFTLISGQDGIDAVYMREIVDEFDYIFKVNGKSVTYPVKEKRIVIFSEKSRKKTLLEIRKEVGKAENITSIKEAIRTTHGDKAKYLTAAAKTEDGKKVKIDINIDEKKVSSDEQLAGFIMYCTSEVNMDAVEVIRVYKQLWKIEESFRVLKSSLDLRPVYLQKPDAIKGHVLICYLALLLTRLLQLNVLSGKYGSEKVVEFIRDFKVFKTGRHIYANCAHASEIIDDLAAKTGIPLYNYELTSKNMSEIEKLVLVPKPQV